MVDLTRYQIDKEAELKIEIELSIEYHRRRAQFLFQFDRMAKLFALASGSFYVFQNLQGTEWQPIIGTFSAVLALLTLVFRISERAADHVDAMSASTKLLGRHLVATHKNDEDELFAIQRELDEVTSSNQHVMESLVKICYNTVARRENLPIHIKIGTCERLLAQFIDLPTGYELIEGPTATL